MPKPLDEWINEAINEWWMSDQAHRLKHGGIWHRGTLGGWSDCGKAWLTSSATDKTVGWGKKRRNPWTAASTTDGKLCKGCFAAEIPWLAHRLKPSDMVNPGRNP